MFIKSTSALLVCFLFSLLLISCASAGNLTCRSNLTYASDYYTCGNDLVDEGRYEDALQAFRTARSMDERFYDEHFGISYQIGWVLNRLGRYEESLREFEKAEKYHPEWINDFVIYYNQGTLLAKLGRYDEALKKFDQSLTIQYYNRYAWFNKGHVLARLERYSEAKEAFDKARKAYGSWVPLLGSYKEAADTYDIARGVRNEMESPIPSITSSPPVIYPTPTYINGLSIDLQLRKGNDFSARYQFDDAVQAFNQVLVNDPSNYRAIEGKGVALANLGQFDEALISLNQATLYLDYHVDESTYLDAWYVKGWVLANLGKYDEAIQAFNKVLMVNPDHFTAYYNKAWVLAKKGQYSESISAYNRSLDWENQVGNDIKPITILAPLGDYKDTADAIEKADRQVSTQQQVQNSSQGMLIYRTDFSQDPQWSTNRPRNYYWNSTKGVYYFISDDNPGFAEIPVLYNGTSFRLEFDISILHADPGTTALLGISQYNSTYNEQNAIFAEFKSWKSGTYRNVKDGDKIYQIKAIDNARHTTNEQYQGACFINREEDRTNPTFGENRIYHGIIQYSKENNIIETRVTDNLHEKNFFVCSGIWYDIGTFRDMNRIILVVREDENAYIEGFIDNISLYSIDTEAASLSALSVSTSNPSLIPENSEETNTTIPATTGPGVSQLDFSLIGIIFSLILFGGIASAGTYVWYNSRRIPANEKKLQQIRNLHQSVEARITGLEFLSGCVLPDFEKADKFLKEEKYQEAEKELLSSKNKTSDLENLEVMIKEWKKEGFDLSQFLMSVNNNPDELMSAFNQLKSNVAKSKGFEQELSGIIQQNQDIIKEEKISQSIKWIQQNIKDPQKAERIREEFNEIRQYAIEHEKTQNQRKTTHELLNSLKSQVSGFVVFGGVIQPRLEQAVREYDSGHYGPAFEILQKIRPEIEELSRYENQIKNWMSQGYSIKNLENETSAGFGTIKNRFEEFGQRIDQLRRIKNRLQNLKNNNKIILSLPEFSAKFSQIEQNLFDPDKVDSVENEITLLEKHVEKICSQQKEQVIKIQSDIKKILFSPEVSDSVKKKILPANKACSSEDYISAEQLLSAVAVQNVKELKNEINQVKNEGANLTWATGHLDGFIEEKKYSDAILETERCIKKIGRLRQAFTQAKSLRTKIADPDLITVFDTGKYAEFIQRVQDHEKAADELESVRKAAQELLGKAEIIGNVPKPVHDLLHSQVIGDIKHATEELANFIKTANPRLTLSLNRNKMELHVWHRINISIENKGNAHALDVNFSFSPEFETRWIRPKSVNAGKTETFENIAIKPTIKGEVPLEISLTFHDARNIEYSEKEEFFIEVIESSTPHTPAYTPDVTPAKIPLKKQLPPELSHLYSDSQFIGRGGFARVFKATKRDGKNVAIKVPISIDPSTGRTFVSEIQNWTKMMHENIVKVYDYNIMPPYFEMELCDESLANLKKPVQNEKATWLVFSICEGLKYAHAQNIIHRDLKPQNILLRNGIPKISDWGLSRVMLSQSTTSASSSFTLNYAAPEQVNNRKQDARTDIWQLGVIFYELVTGNLPFRGDTVTDTIIAIATQNPVKPSVLNPDAEELDSIIMRCLEKDPAKRYPSVLELQKEIGTYLKMNYTNSLNESLLTKNYGRSTDYCADLLLVNMKLGCMVDAYKYASDLAQFVSGELKNVAEEFAEQLKIRVEMNLLTIPDELVNKADVLVHKVKLQRK